MQQAEILAAEGYKEWTGTVMHRFLVLELHRFNRKPIWLRVDRRRARDVSAFRFLAARGTTPANDTVRHSPGWILLSAQRLDLGRASSRQGKPHIPKPAREPPDIPHGTNTRRAPARLPCYQHCTEALPTLAGMFCVIYCRTLPTPLLGELLVLCIATPTTSRRCRRWGIPVRRNSQSYIGSGYSPRD